MKDLSELKNKVLSTIGKAADAGKDIANKAADAGKDVADKVAVKAKTGTRIAKLSIDIANEKENMKKTYLEIGKLYYDTHKDDPEGFFIQLCDEVALSQKSIEEKEAEIDALRAESGEDADVEVEFENVVSGDEQDAVGETEEKSEDDAVVTITLPEDEDAETPSEPAEPEIDAENKDEE